MKKAISVLGAMSAALLLKASLLQPPSPHGGMPWPMRSVRREALTTMPGEALITIDVEDGHLHEVFRDVAEQAQSQLWISPGVDNFQLSYSAAGAPVKDVLSELCERDRCRWKLVTSIVVWDSTEPTPEWSLGNVGSRP